MVKTKKVLTFLSILAWLPLLDACSSGTEVAETGPSEAMATLILDGLTNPSGVALSPQGAVYTVDGEGQIHRVLSQRSSMIFAETGGRVEDLAFDGSGDLLVTDSQKKAVLRITPWSEVSLLAEGLEVPRGITVSADGDIYVVDSGTSALLRWDSERGKFSELRTGLDRPRDVIASSAERCLFVSGEAGQIWKIANDGEDCIEFASFSDEGQPAGMALDEEGNLYIARDGEGQVTVLSPEGELIENYPLPGPGVASIVFGGANLESLFVSEASTGSIYKIEAEARSQRLAWEPDRRLRFTSPVDGDILNRHDGQVVLEGLLVPIRGTFAGEGFVKINGEQLELVGKRFETNLLLTEKENRIRAEASDGTSLEITVLWDRASFPRYRVSTDDNIWFLRDIAENAAKYESIFENPYLALWRDMNQKYGCKVDHNIYYETEGFNLSQMPSKFRTEWQRNADWMHLSFHARSNDPDRPYINSSAERIRTDYQLIAGEINRFAGPEVLTDVTTIHWGEATLAAARAVRDEGINTLVGYFRGNHGLPSVCYYLDLNQWQHLMRRDYWKDMEEDIQFVRHDIIINTHDLEEIVPFLEKIVADPHQSEVMELMIHEQYFYPDYRAYQPDFREKVETAIKFVVDRGYEPVFFADGFLGTVQE